MQRRMTICDGDHAWRGLDEDVVEMFAYSDLAHDTTHSRYLSWQLLYLNASVRLKYQTTGKVWNIVRGTSIRHFVKVTGNVYFDHVHFVFILCCPQHSQQFSDFEYHPWWSARPTWSQSWHFNSQKILLPEQEAATAPKPKSRESWRHGWHNCRHWQTETQRWSWEESFDGGWSSMGARWPITPRWRHFVNMPHMITFTPMISIMQN